MCHDVFRRIWFVLCDSWWRSFKTVAGTSTRLILTCSLWGLLVLSFAFGSLMTTAGICRRTLVIGSCLLWGGYWAAVGVVFCCWVMRRCTVSRCKRSFLVTISFTALSTVQTMLLYSWMSFQSTLRSAQIQHRTDPPPTYIQLARILSHRATPH